MTQIDPSAAARGSSDPTESNTGRPAAAPNDPELQLAIRLLGDHPDCVKIMSLDGRIEFMNSAGARLNDLEDASQVFGRKWQDLWPAEACSLLELGMREANAGRVKRFTCFAPTRKGIAKWWDVVVSPFRGEGGTVKWLLAISRDMTRHRAFEDQLRISEQQFRALADNVDQLAWMCDATGYVFWYNKRWFEYTGATLEEMTGWGWKKIQHPSHVDRVVTKIAAHFASGEDWEDTFPLRGSDGRYRWFLSRARPIRDDAGHVLMWCGTNTDITDQRNAGARLRQKARLIELSHEAILVWDFDSGIVTWNTGCEDLYGFTRGEAVGKRSHVLLSSTFPMSVEDFEATLLKEGSWSGEIRHTAKDGSQVWVESRQEVLLVDGRPLVLETNRDVTERRRAEEIRSLLIGELNHRVKNTLAIVQSIASQTARASRDLRHFTSSFNDRIQSLSAAQNVLTEANWSGADLQEIVSSQLVDGTGISAAIRLSGAPVFLSAQMAMQISLIIHELASNARKYGALSVPRGNVDVSWELDRDGPAAVRIVWRERGGPVVHKPRTRGFGSTLIERVGSQPHLKVSISFEPDGLVCTIVADVPERLPATSFPYFNPGRPLQSPGGARSPLRAEPNGPRRVLVIEDEPLIAMDLEEIMADAGFLVVATASSVAEALTAIETRVFDIALLDGNLLGSPVDEVAAELARRGKPFVFVTGFTQQGLPEGFADVPIVKKPLQTSTLVRVVNSVIDGKVRTSP